jgi:hypothetical protein
MLVSVHKLSLSYNSEEQYCTSLLLLLLLSSCLSIIGKRALYHFLCLCVVRLVRQFAADDFHCFRTFLSFHWCSSISEVTFLVRKQVVYIVSRVCFEFLTWWPEETNSFCNYGSNCCICVYRVVFPTEMAPT